MDEATQAWIERAQYDYDTALAMLETGRWIYVLFCCQQSVEKSIKAFISARTGELPPRIHNLVRLADEAGLELTPELHRFLGELSAYYIQSRYPEDSLDLSGMVDHGLAEETVQQTAKVNQWLRSMLA